MNNGRINGRFLLWTMVLCVFLFLGAVFVFMPQYRERACSSFPLLHRFASAMDGAAEQLTQGSAAGETIRGIFQWGDGCAETNSDS